MPYSQLESNNVTLSVKVTEFRTDVGKRIRGTFVVDSRNNSILDIQRCFGSSLDVKAALCHNDRFYTLTLTSLRWDWEPLLDTENEPYGSTVAYQCDFIAMAEETPNE